MVLKNLAKEALNTYIIVKRTGRKYFVEKQQEN